MPRRRWCSALLFLAASLAAAPVAATTVDVRSTTLIQGRVEPRPGEEQTVLPIIEIVSFDATTITNPLVDNLSLRVTAWGRLDPVEPDGRLGDAADLDRAYLSGELFDRRLSFKLGRHFVFGGAARGAQIDGASTAIRVFRGFGVSAFGGLPVLPRFAVASSDGIAGGRVFYRHSIDAEVGASFLQLWDHGTTARQEAGFDGRLVVYGVTFGALALWSVPDERVAEAELSVSVQPFAALRAQANVRRTEPDLFLSRTSILSVFASETRDELGGSLSWRPSQPLSLLGEYHYLRYGAEGEDEASMLADQTGHEGLLRLTWTPPRLGLTVGLQGRMLSVPVNGYYQGRLFGHWQLSERVGAALDLDAYRFKAPINGYEQSYVASFSLTYAVSRSWMAALTALGSVTPYFERRVEGIAKLVYNFSTYTREVEP